MFVHAASRLTGSLADGVRSMEDAFSIPPTAESVAMPDAAPMVSGMRDSLDPVSPGWYPDPSGSGLLRFFDGRAFTNVTRTPEPKVRSVTLEDIPDVPAFSVPAFASEQMEATTAFLAPPLDTPELQVSFKRRVLAFLLPRPTGVRTLLRLAGTACLLVSITTLSYALWENRLSAWTASRAQAALRAEFDAAMEASSTSSPPDLAVPRPGSTKAPTTTPPTLPLPLVAPKMPAHGQLAGRLTIPSIGLDKMILVGTDQDILAKGPGVWESGVFPGAPGNATISGHRTTHGGPFRHIDELKEGDIIVFETPGEPRAVFEVRGRGQVSPHQIEVTGQGPGVRLTLTTCDPPGTAAKRLVIQAELVEGDFTRDALSPADWKFRG